MQSHLSEIDDDYIDEDSDKDYHLRKPNHNRRKLEEYMEQKRLKRFLEDDYDYEFDE